MKRKALVKNLALTVINILAVFAFLFVPQFSCAGSFLSDSADAFSLLYLISRADAFRFFLIFAVTATALASIIELPMLFLKKQTVANVLLLILPITQIMLQFAVIFSFLTVNGGQSVFFSQFTVHVSLPVFLVPLISLYKVKITEEE